MVEVIVMELPVMSIKELSMAALRTELLINAQILLLYK
jgi:hypothetical protein